MNTFIYANTILMHNIIYIMYNHIIYITPTQQMFRVIQLPVIIVSGMKYKQRRAALFWFVNVSNLFARQLLLQQFYVLLYNDIFHDINVCGYRSRRLSNINCLVTCVFMFKTNLHLCKVHFKRSITFTTND